MNKKIKKPWGYEIIWAHTEKYVGKILYIKSKNRLSLQFHKEKEETIYVISGLLFLIYGEDKSSLKEVCLKPGDSWHIKPGLIHRFCAKDEDVKLAEVSTTELDDVVRISDDYNRDK